MEVIDGQQRLRTILAFIDPNCLKDYDESSDSFSVRPIHNRGIAGMPFNRLPLSIKQAIISYELSTHIFPATTGDELVYRMFARLNSTGLFLKPQELRNAKYHGDFKSLVYQLSFSYFSVWREMRIFSDEQISRMDEAEAVSDLIVTMIEGISGKTQSKLDNYYKVYEDEMVHINDVSNRFQVVMNYIVGAFGDLLPKSAFRRPALFYSLFTAVYDHAFGLASEFDARPPNPLPANSANYLSATLR